jgi:hypothetical protein
MQRLVKYGFEAANPGTLYRTLIKMENGGFVTLSGKRLLKGQHEGYTPSPIQEGYILSWGLNRWSSTSRIWMLFSKSIGGAVEYAPYK